MVGGAAVLGYTHNMLGSGESEFTDSQTDTDIQTESDRDRKGQTETDKDRQRLTETDRDRQTDRHRQIDRLTEKQTLMILRTVSQSSFKYFPCHGAVIQKPATISFHTIII